MDHESPRLEGCFSREPEFLYLQDKNSGQDLNSQPKFKLNSTFNNQMYKQLDGVAMGSPLGPALANIFVGFHESRLFDNTLKPGVYFRFVDDTFAIFGSELDCDHFKGKLNLLHPALKFTVEKEQNNSLNFLNVLVEKDGTGFLTSV